DDARPIPTKLPHALKEANWMLPSDKTGGGLCRSMVHRTDAARRPVQHLALCWKDWFDPMNTMIRVILFCLALTGNSAYSQPQPQPQPDNVEAFLRIRMQKRRIPGLQVVVVRHGKIVLLGAYGLANIEHSVPVTNETVFSINSATKSFTGVAIMQLVEAGKL